MSSANTPYSPRHAHMQPQPHPHPGGGPIQQQQQASHHAHPHHQLQHQHSSSHTPQLHQTQQQQQQQQHPGSAGLPAPNASTYGGGVDLAARTALMGNPQPDEEDEEDNLDTYDNEEDGDDDDGEGDGSGDIAVPSNGGSRRGATAGSGTRGRKPRGSGASTNARNAGASGQDPPRKNKKGGGRPKDFIWAFFTETEEANGKRAATCRSCHWRCEQPKAFRMRAHVLSCGAVPRHERERVAAAQAQKDVDDRERKRLKELADDANFSPPPAPGAAARADSSYLFAPPTGVPGSSAYPGTFARDGTAQPELDSRPPPSGSGLFFGSSTYDLTGESPSDLTNGDVSGLLPGPSSTRKRRRNGNTAAIRGVKDEYFALPNLPMAAKAGRSPITCHVLDSTAGKPGANIKLRMDQLSQTGFSHVASGETDADGRNNSLLLPGTQIEKNSVFKLTFYTREYWQNKEQESFYPFVEIVFEVKEPSEHYHIALMLSPYAYTTYRGS